MYRKNVRLEYQKVTIKDAVKYFPALKEEDITGDWFFEMRINTKKSVNYPVYQKEKYLVNYEKERCPTGEILDLQKVINRMILNLKRMRLISFVTYPDKNVCNCIENVDSIVVFTSVIRSQTPRTLQYGMIGKDNYQLEL